MNNRFDRQVILSGFGEDSQNLLRQSKVLIIGAGGLGCPVILYLAAAGVGCIGIVDGDKVTASNLNRQVLYGESDINQPKAIIAGNIIKNKYHDIEVHSHPFFIHQKNAIELINEYDIILDGSDNFQTRYIVNDACVLLKKALIIGAVYQNEGQVMVFDMQQSNPIHYRDIYPQMPLLVDSPNCNQIGVLGVLTGLIGLKMSTAAIQYITRFGELKTNHLYYENIYTHNHYNIQINKNPLAQSPQTIEAFEQYSYLQEACHSNEIEWSQVFQLSHEPETLLIDIREKYEMPKLEGIRYQSFSSEFVIENFHQFEKIQSLILFCQTGNRSIQLLKQLLNEYPNKHIYSVRGGINSYNN